jgi:chemotaxis family two-component system sensor kinase Cph1
MGVRATLTIWLVIDGKLWGMIACHHGKPWSGPFAFRQDCQFLGQVTAAQIRCAGGGGSAGLPNEANGNSGQVSRANRGRR